MTRKASVGIVGLGLVGGSLARALTAAGVRVVGVDRPVVLRRAQKAGAIDTALDLRSAAGSVDVLVLAAPPKANLALLRRLARVAPAGLVVTDVTSVKGPMVAEARRLGVRFVGGHPMAGTEKAGFAASRADLFRGRPWILTPSRDAGALRSVRSLARRVGARPVTMSPAEHDRFVALVSHLPQVLSWALMAAVDADPTARRNRHLAGPGFHDMTRLARSPQRLWAEILASNRAEVARALRALQRALSSGALWR